jgi:transposase
MDGIDLIGSGRIYVTANTYSPDDNPIDRFWEDFHAEVTRNHQCRTMGD